MGVRGGELAQAHYRLAARTIGQIFPGLGDRSVGLERQDVNLHANALSLVSPKGYTLVILRLNQR